MSEKFFVVMGVERGAMAYLTPRPSVAWGLPLRQGGAGRSLPGVDFRRKKHANTWYDHVSGSSSRLMRWQRWPPFAPTCLGTDSLHLTSAAALAFCGAEPS